SLPLVAPLSLAKAVRNWRRASRLPGGTHLRWLADRLWPLVLILDLSPAFLPARFPKGGSHGSRSPTDSWCASRRSIGCCLRPDRAFCGVDRARLETRRGRLVRGG